MVVGARLGDRARGLITSNGRLDKTLYNAEQELLDPEVRRSRSRLEELLHQEFSETGSTGNLYDRETIIQMMLEETPARVIIRDFQAQPLDTDTALVTYRSVGGGGQEARRTSIWTRTDGHWQLRYHQGTRVPDTWGRIS